MNDEVADFSGAIAAVSGAVASMNQRQENLLRQIAVLKKHRRDKLDQQVIAWLPEISPAVLRGLREVVPAFAAERQVDDAFARNKKFLGIFKPAGYDAALTLLRARLKQQCERMGVAAAEDREIALLDARLRALDAQAADAMATLRVLEDSRRSGAPLPPVAVAGINTLAKHRGVTPLSGSDHRVPGQSSLTANVSSAASSSSDSDMDLWLWMITDTPTSLRTLLLDFASHHHESSRSTQSGSFSLSGGGDFGGGGASGYFGVAPQSDATQDLQPNIATDDRLGAFS